MSISINEVSNIDNQSSLSIHGYVLQGWKQIFIILTLDKKCKPSPIFDLGNLINNGGPTKAKIARLICLGVDGVIVFQGLKKSAIMLMRAQHVPFFINVHYVAHKTKLIVQALSYLSIVSKLKDLFTKLYGYFSRSHKCALELSNIAIIMELKGFKIFQNVKTRWISIWNL
jgi:hypothetical protein